MKKQYTLDDARKFRLDVNTNHGWIVSGPPYDALPINGGWRLRFKFWDRWPRDTDQKPIEITGTRMVDADGEIVTLRRYLEPITNPDFAHKGHFTDGICSSNPFELGEEVIGNTGLRDILCHSNSTVPMS